MKIVYPLLSFLLNLSQVKHKIYCHLSFVLLLLLVTSTGYAQPTLDTTFGNKGKAQSERGRIHCSFLQADGKIVVGGIDSTLSPVVPFVRRYNKNGTPDSSFATNGIFRGDSVLLGGIIINDIAIDSMGRLVLAGNKGSFYRGDGKSFLLRLKINGNPDSTFGSNGIVNLNDSADLIQGLLIKPNGKILAGGYHLKQFNSDGTRDTSYKSLPNHPLLTYPIAQCTNFALQPDNKVIAVGTTHFQWYPNSFIGVSAAIRVLDDGTIDSTFGTNGIWYDKKINNTRALQVRRLGNGKILLLGSNPWVGIRLFRLTEAGVEDSTFAVNGVAEFHAAGESIYPNSMDIRNDGKIVVEAVAFYNAGQPNYLIRYDSTGRLDNSFGKKGRVVVNLYGHSVLVQQDDKIVVSGFITDANTARRYSAVWRFVPEPLVTYNTIAGAMFFDRNSNNIKDASEPYFNPAKVITYKATDTIPLFTASGRFSTDVDTGTYETKVIPYQPYFNIVPSTRSSSFTSWFNTDSVSFAVQPIAGMQDVGVYIIPPTRMTPGFDAAYTLYYVNKGTDTITNGKIHFVKDSRLIFNGASTTPASIQSDTITWNYVNLYPLDTASITVYTTVQPPPGVNIGDSIAVVASIDPLAGDLQPEDNTCKVVRLVTGAYDPNDKQEIHGGEITIGKVVVGEYLQYTVRFQNTGNDTAFKVMISDYISDNLDINTLQMISSSHDYQLTAEGRVMIWTFNNIYLVDSNTNEPLSHGFITFKVKVRQDLAVGDQVFNAASIYFDFNEPIHTNTAITNIVSNILPVKLLAFTAKKNNRTNVLHWESAKEVRLKGYEVQRSNTGRDFNTIGFVNAGIAKYEFVDGKAPKSMNYYRLKMINKDGGFTYSPIRLVDNTSSFYVSLYPNPAKEKMQVQVESEKQSQLQLKVLSDDGKVVLTRTLLVNEGKSIQELNIRNLQSGNYYLLISRGVEEQMAVKFKKL